MENLRLRALEPEDLVYLYDVENDSNLWEVSETRAPYSKLALRQYLKQAHLPIAQTNQLRLVVERTTDFQAVGLVDLYDYCPHNHRAGVGIVIHPGENRGKGYGTIALQLICEYAFTHLHLHQLYALIAADNQASIQLFQTAGFEQTGIKKQWLRKSAGYLDVYFYQLISPKREN